MALKILQGKKDTRWISVAVDEIGDDDQVIGTLKFRAELKITPSSQWELDLANNNQRELLTEKLVNWDGIQNEDGTKAEFTPENVEALLDVQPVQNALFVELINVQAGRHASGYKAAKLKN